MTKKISWIFPKPEMILMRIETVFISMLAALVFVISFFQADQEWFPATIVTVVFLAIYVIIALLIQEIRKVKQTYHISPTHLHLTKETRTKTKKDKISLKHIVHHKLDKTFLGGYVITKDNKRHALYFSDQKEIEKFEKFITKHKKSKKKTSTTKVKKATIKKSAKKKQVKRKTAVKKRAVKKKVVKKVTKKKPSKRTKKR